MIPGLRASLGKMSSSAPAGTKIMFSDSTSTVQKKIAGGDLPAGTDLSNNGIMAMFEHIVFPFRNLRLSADRCFEVRLVSGLSKAYGEYDSLKEDVAKGLVDTESLQSVLSTELTDIMEPVREEYAASTKWRLAEQLGYDMVDMDNMRI
jgi:tyrosyl-tRNA synthetase